MAVGLGISMDDLDAGAIPTCCAQCRNWGSRLPLVLTFHKPCASSFHPGTVWYHRHTLEIGYQAIRDGRRV